MATKKKVVKKQRIRLIGNGKSMLLPESSLGRAIRISPFKHEEKRGRGAPTKYSKDIIIKTKEYLEECTDRIMVFHRPKIVDGVVVEGVEEAYTKEVVKVPTLEGLAVYLDINKDTVQDWKNDKEKSEFSVLIDKLLQKQASVLVSKGLSGEYNPTIAKVLLSKHGYREATEVEEKVTHKIDISSMLDKAYSDDGPEED